MAGPPPPPMDGPSTTTGTSTGTGTAAGTGGPPKPAGTGADVGGRVGSRHSEGRAPHDSESSLSHSVSDGATVSTFRVRVRFVDMQSQMSHCVQRVAKQRNSGCSELTSSLETPTSTTFSRQVGSHSRCASECDTITSTIGTSIATDHTNATRPRRPESAEMLCRQMGSPHTHHTQPRNCGQPLQNSESSLSRHCTLNSQWPFKQAVKRHSTGCSTVVQQIVTGHSTGSRQSFSR